MTKQPTPTTSRNKLGHDIERILAARHHAPLSVLGLHRDNDQNIIRVCRPDCLKVRIAEDDIELQRLGNSDFFEYRGPSKPRSRHYQLHCTHVDGNESLFIDPYTFPVSIADFDIGLFAIGKHQHIYRILGAHEIVLDQVPGVRFAVWAPNAERVSVVGNFNAWDGRIHLMQNRGHSGLWELFIPQLTCGQLYKFEVRARDSGRVFTKCDPYAMHSEKRPHTASIVAAAPAHEWNDSLWLSRRPYFDFQRSPISIYEVHLGSWQRTATGDFLNYRELAPRLVEHVESLGFTHIELLPVNEHPLDDSWGYQTTGYYAPTSRFGTPDDFRYFIDYCHQHDLGVIMDWVPAHFPRDAHGLATFDGSALYEHADPRRGEHRDWGTLIFNYGRNEVRNFLLANAVYWIEEFHIDGLRVDAVASLIYLDYSREDGDWLPNQYGGNENLEAIDFIRELNEVVHKNFPGALTIAEESTAWPAVSRPTSMGGLGFTMKWNMGWMHDTLSYMQKDPIHRQHHHNQLTFGMLYAYSENFVLPFSHDEVVHGKRSMLDKMPGDEWQKFANLRALYTYMFTYPGKKLLFMGAEFAPWTEWNHKQVLDWNLYAFDNHKAIHRVVKDLNKIYRESPALHRYEFDDRGFCWLDCNNSAQSVLCYLRKCEDDNMLIALNLTPVPRTSYKIGVPYSGTYRVVFNSDSIFYAGSNFQKFSEYTSSPDAYMNQPSSIEIDLPPLSGLILRHFP